MAKLQDEPKSEGKVEGTEEGPKKQTVNGKLVECMKLLERGTKWKDSKLLNGRLMRQTAALRTVLDPSVLQTLAQHIMPNVTHGSLRDVFNKVHKDSMDIDVEKNGSEALPELDLDVLPELEAWTALLLIMYYVDNGQYEEAKDVCSASMQQMQSSNRRTLDGIAAKTFFYFSLVHERTEQLAQIRGQLLGLHRATIINHNELGQETILNLLLRNYLHYNLYEQAESFRGKAQKSDVWRSSQQLCRYLFYMGKIRAVQLEYNDAKDFLSQASRKAPVVATGFQVIVLKWLTVVRLLLGEIADHSDFKQPSLEQQLRPYFHLTQAVRTGDLSAFGRVAEEHERIFRRDGTHNLITRLRHNVIRAGLRRINIAYSRISIADIARKLNLSSGEDTESILSKAIRDGGVEATIDHTNKWMISKQTVDVYATSDPQAAYHARIAFCLDVHNEAVRAMQFEDEDAKKKLETIESSRERAMLDEEYAKALLEDEEFDDGI